MEIQRAFFPLFNDYAALSGKIFPLQNMENKTGYFPCLANIARLYGNFSLP
jgi:hypothetical protein